MSCIQLYHSLWLYQSLWSSLSGVGVDALTTFRCYLTWVVVSCFLFVFNLVTHLFSQLCMLIQLCSLSMKCCVSSFSSHSKRLNQTVRVEQWRSPSTTYSPSHTWCRGTTPSSCSQVSVSVSVWSEGWKRVGSRVCVWHAEVAFEKVRWCACYICVWRVGVVYLCCVCVCVCMCMCCKYL